MAAKKDIWRNFLWVICSYGAWVMAELNPRISSWYWASFVAWCGLLLLWLIENPKDAETVLFIFYSPFFLVLLSGVCALRQNQLESFARGPAAWLFSAALFFCAVQIANPVSITEMAISFLYATAAIAGLWYTGSLWLKEQTREQAIP